MLSHHTLRRQALPSLALLLFAQLVPHLARAEGRGVYDPLPLRPKDAELIQTSGELEGLLARRGALLAEGPETALVRRVGQAVVPKQPADAYQRFRFGVLRSPVPNAFALADGQIYVHTGLLALLENEAQLAAVLAHESMHVEGHHPILHARQARVKAGWMVVLGITLGQVGNLLSLPLLQATIGYGRDLEAEADHHALDRLLAAGYDPREMPRVFLLLDEDPEAERRDPKPAWSDHPLNEARAASARARLEEFAPRIAELESANGPLIIGKEGFSEVVRWSMSDTVVTMLDLDRPRTAASFARKATERWPESAEAWALLGESLRHLDARLEVIPDEARTKKLRRARLRELERMTRSEREALRRARAGSDELLGQNFAAAKNAYRKALIIEPEHALALRGLAYLLDDEGALLEAGEFLARYLAAAPADDLDRPTAVKRLAGITSALRQQDSTEARP